MSSKRPLQAVPRVDVYAEIRRRIVRLEYAPGESLDEKSLLIEFGTSRTPVREALIRLSGEGLIDIERNKGAKVSDLDLPTLQSIFEAGDLIERAYTRLACLRRDEQDLVLIDEALQQFEKDLARKDVGAMTQSNSDFHLRIAHASRNKYFIDSYRRILADHERIAQIWYSHNLIAPANDTHELVCAQHKDLLDALRHRDADRAEQVSIEHASLCKEGIRQLLSGGEQLMANLTVTPIDFTA